ncbi:beta-glucoside-specific PTS transporter subunit IIABC [Alkalicoccobacillus plakortidis]|uniref:Beta-glucoside-specific PTS transporter subunit IIABC n=1 Tax=Alkalicoccobacillus plakortidis TaxID=444060 RepID=A0ABT0XP35_9BACI|nr:beta-glucoside-specific PTS transporter subunit IIABC [Alkalicoccobacillus plakortidis]MCM2677572.1 beta-glucoside-specific PTS transporter subunit IIABC [Alkalicoccobacillus plakortidis]
MNHSELANEIVKHIGGKSNIDHMTHCMTRLRFNLNDNDQADRKALEKLDGIVGTNISGSQFQVIIGNDVPAVYKAIVAQTGGSQGSEKNQGNKKKEGNPLNRLFDFISGVFAPILIAVAGSGMIKGLLALIAAFEWMNTEGSTYIILNAIGDGVFYFLPLILAVSAAHKLGSNPYIAAGIAAAILHPSISALLSSGEAVTFFGIPIIQATYASSVIPILITIWLASHFERVVDRWIHKSLKLLLVPMIVMLVMVPVLILAIGPLGTLLGDGLSVVVTGLMTKTGVFGGIFLGALMPIITITGMHYGLVPVILNSLAQKGYDYIIPVTFVSNMGQAGSAFGVFLKSRNKKLKALALSTSITALMGVTEPAMYGVNMRLKRPFYAAMIGGAAGGAVLGLFGVKAYVLSGIGGLPGIPTLIGPTFLYGLLGMVIAFVVATIVTYVLGFEDFKEKDLDEVVNEGTDSEKTSIAQVQSEEIFSPIKGFVEPLSAVPDPTFADELMGKGVAIRPTDGIVVSPVKGTVSALFKTNHAIGLKSETGAEILIHIGIDTVKLNGKHFTSYIQVDDTVEIGQKLVSFDQQAIEQEGYETITPIIVTNTAEYSSVDGAVEKDVEQGETLLTLN